MPSFKPAWHRNARPLLVGLGACLCIGCATPELKYSSPALGAPSAWHNASAQDRMSGTTAQVAWWRGLGDDLLAGLVDEALRVNSDLAAARGRLREARARRLLAGAERWPTLGASAGASRSRASEDSGGATRSLYSAGFDAAWEPDIFGGIGHGIDAAQADQERARANLDNAYISLAAEVALNYIELRAYQGRLAIARSNLAIQAETLQIAEWRAQAGLVTALDVEQARASLEQTRAQLPSLETGLAEARHRLAILLGKAPGELNARLDAPGTIPAIPDRMVLSIPADTLRQRPDVRAAERSLAAETARLGVAESNRWPSLTLSGSLGLDAATLGGLGGDAASGALLAKFAGSLFDAGRLKYRVEIQDAVREQAEKSYASIVLSALEDVENALVGLANGRRRQAMLRDAARAAGDAARLASQQYQAGLIDFQSVLSTQRSLLAIQDSLKSGEADTAAALVRLYKALGGGWPAEEQP